VRLVLDFETYYDKDYSLGKLYTWEYVRDTRFKVHGVAVKVDDEETQWLSDDAFKSFIDSIRDDDVELICHNTYFDGLVLFTHYEYVPTIFRDTLSMARALLPHAESHSLDYLCTLLGIGEKLPEILDLTKGKRILPPELFAQLGTYAINDVELTLGLWDKLSPGLPDDELALIDLTLRWGCCPALHVDLPRAQAALKAVTDERNQKIRDSGESLETLSSQPRFVECLLERGIEVPTKPNSKGKEIPALAKNDLGFRQMVADNPEHHALFAGRLAAKSTIEVTRIKRLIEIGYRGTLPMPLKFYGAHTGRWSGADGLNPQNFTRGSEMRKSIIAPPGYVLLVADLKQIELRVNMWFCYEDYWLDILRSGEDVYVAAAAQHFDVPPDAVTSSQRFFGKTTELGLGYQCGWQKFRTICALRDIVLTEEEAFQTVQTYRLTHPCINSKWLFLQHQLIGMYNEGYSLENGPVTYVHEGILLPNGMRLDYTGLTPQENNNWSYGVGRKFTYIYGGKMLENIVQALARIVLGQQMLEIHRRGIHIASSTHDEVLMIVRENEADQVQAEVEAIMRTPPDWAPDLPLDVEAGWAREYSK
jgi:DNA polymerase